MDKNKRIEELADLINDIDNNAYAYDNDGYEIFGYADAKKIAEVIVIADYVKVIRCGNCKWRRGNICTNHCGTYGAYICNPNWFCCAGQYKDLKV